MARNPLLLLLKFKIVYELHIADSLNYEIRVCFLFFLYRTNADRWNGARTSEPLVVLLAGPGPTRQIDVDRLQENRSRSINSLAPRLWFLFFGSWTLGRTYGASMLGRI